MSEVIKSLESRYLGLMHAVQTGIAYKISAGETEHTPKHLRVGVNSAMVSNAAVVKLLVKKGVFTWQEYWEQMVEEAEAEVKRYEDWIQEHSGKNIRLG